MFPLGRISVGFKRQLQFYTRAIIAVIAQDLTSVPQVSCECPREQQILVMYVFSREARQQNGTLTANV